MLYFVGIHGRFKAGKDTLANWLAAELGGWIRVHICHFAAELRNAIELMSAGKIQAVNTWTEAHKAAVIPMGIVWDLTKVFPSISAVDKARWEKEILPSMAATGKTIGKLLQDIGMLGRQTEGEDIWVDRFEQKLPKIEQGAKAVVLIPDFRFPNEATWLMRHNASLHKIDTGARTIKDTTGRDTSHLSEVALKDFKAWNLVVDNSGTLEQYKKNSQLVLYYVNAQLSGVYLNMHELVQLLAKRLEELAANKPALYTVPGSVHDLCEVARQECKQNLLGDYVIERQILNRPVRTLVRFLTLPFEY